MKENAFLNFHLSEDCSNNSKVGFQSLNSDVAALKKNLSVVKGWAETAILKDGDVICIFARYTESDSASEMAITQLKLADGTTRDIPAAAPADAGEDEIPY